jgi:hypothetical protein
MSQQEAGNHGAKLLAFADLRSVDVGAYIEKKNNLSYLSWAWAVDQLLQRDPGATWEYRFGTDPTTDQAVPFVVIGNTAMVFCTVHAFGVDRTAQLPVMDHRNKPIPNPDAFQVNTAMQRCLAKAIALHGLGLYIYAGEDLPDAAQAEPEPKLSAEQIQKAKETLADCGTLEELRKTFAAMSAEMRAATQEFAVALKKNIEAAEGN